MGRIAHNDDVRSALVDPPQGPVGGRRTVLGALGEKLLIPWGLDEVAYGPGPPWVRFETPRPGVLLALLEDAVVGLCPTRQGTWTAVGDLYEGHPLTAEVLAVLELGKWPTECFQPSAVQVAAELDIIIFAFATTALAAGIGGLDG